MPFLSRTWAPKGHTPISEEKGGKEHRSGAPSESDRRDGPKRAAVRRRAEQVLQRRGGAAFWSTFAANTVART